MLLKEYKELLRVQRLITFRNDPQSIAKALQWTRSFVNQNINDPKLSCRLKELATALRTNVVQLEVTGQNKYRVNLHKEIEYGPKDPKDIRPSPGCCQESVK